MCFYYFSLPSFFSVLSETFNVIRNCSKVSSVNRKILTMAPRLPVCNRTLTAIQMDVYLQQILVLNRILMTVLVVHSIMILLPNFSKPITALLIHATLNLLFACDKLIKMSILLNIMFHAPMGRFQLEVIYYFFTYFSTVVPSNFCVSLSCRPFIVNTTFSTGIVGLLEEGTSTPTRPVENVVLTTKGLQDRNNNFLMEGRWKIKVN